MLVARSLHQAIFLPSGENIGKALKCPSVVTCCKPVPACKNLTIVILTISLYYIELEISALWVVHVGGENYTRIIRKEERSKISSSVCKLNRRGSESNILNWLNLKVFLISYLDQDMHVNWSN